jgi:hypothetical protein
MVFRPLRRFDGHTSQKLGFVCGTLLLALWKAFRPCFLFLSLGLGTTIHAFAQARLESRIVLGSLSAGRVLCPGRGYKQRHAPCSAIVVHQGTDRARSEPPTNDGEKILPGSQRLVALALPGRRLRLNLDVQASNCHYGSRSYQTQYTSNRFHG